MYKYENYLSNELGIEKVEYLKCDDLSYYFKGTIGKDIVKIKVVDTRVYINERFYKYVKNIFEFIKE